MAIRSALAGQRVLVNLPASIDPSEQSWRSGVAIRGSDPADAGQYIQIRDGSTQDGMVVAVTNYGIERGQWCLPEDAPPESLWALPKEQLVLRLQRALSRLAALESDIEEMDSYISEMERAAAQS